MESIHHRIEIGNIKLAAGGSIGLDTGGNIRLDTVENSRINTVENIGLDTVENSRINTVENSRINTVELYRSFKGLINTAKLPIPTKNRLRYKKFNFDTAKRIILAYSLIISNSDNCMVLRLKTIKKLYNYKLIFISDLFKYTSSFVLNGLYSSARRILSEIDSNTTITENTNLHKLKKFAKCSILKVINAIKFICINNTNILIRLPYSIFSTITDYDIYKIYSEYDGALLDKDVANTLNNIFKIDIILILIKKMNIYIILYILEYILFKEELYCNMFGTIEKINNSRYPIIIVNNLIKIII